jgi:hypothetical protein
MRDLEFYFSDRRMVAQLCRKRIAHARKNRRDQFPARAAGVHDSERADDPKQHELQALLPPRRHWPRARRRIRRESEDRSATTAKTLAEHVLRVLSENAGAYPWVKRLRRFLNSILRDALSWDKSMVHEPKSVVPIPKDRRGSGQKYRVVVTYSLRDSLLASGYAAYLGDGVDGALDDCCFGSRPCRNGKTRNHHDAVKGLRAFATRVSDETDLWGAECDIQGFFDSVPHEVAKARLRAMAAKAGARLDKRAIAFLHSFLASYDYVSARKKALTQLRAQHVDRPILFKPKAALVKAGIEFDCQERRGIPQGSPLSGVIANAVLAAADDACLNELRRNGRWHYARYCDDILLVSTDRNACRLALRAYRRELRNLGLADHRAVKVLPYRGRNKKRFWDGKSKLPYLWRSGELGPGVPWIGFLGYQLKRDGTLRIRRASIQREIAKQMKAVNDVISTMQKVRAKAVASGTAYRIAPMWRIEHRVLTHLVAMGVGYPSGHATSPPPSSLSWCNAYPLLQSGPVDLAPLKDLDRGRTLAMKALRGKLVALVNTSNDIAVTGATRLVVVSANGCDLKRDSEEAGPRRPFCLRYAGNALSYYGKFATTPARKDGGQWPPNEIYPRTSGR